MCRELMIIELENALFYCYLMVKGVLSVGWLFSLRFGTGERRRSWASSVRLFTCNATRVFYHVLRRYGRPKTSRYPRVLERSVLQCYHVFQQLGPSALQSLACLEAAVEAHTSECKLFVREEPEWRVRHQRQKKSHLNKLQSNTQSERKPTGKACISSNWAWTRPVSI